MLVNLSHILKKADEERYAVGGFNMTTLESALGIVEAAEAEKSPVILQITEKTIDYMGLDVAFAIAKTLADNSSVPVVIHFDHGRNFPLVEDAVKIGFSSVMLDVSKMPESERIPFVKTFAKTARHRGVTVEVEEDIIGGKEDYVDGKHWHFTDPARAASFAKETSCDAFAVSIGNSHGKPQPHETFDLKLLSEINQAVSCPLVLHGASSTPDHLIRDAISRGVCKINIDTDLRLAFTKELRATLAGDKNLYDPRDELRSTIGEIKEVVIEKIRLFGSDNKA
ncbi:MAG TPA: class II fructose-bisphosphate aldolase [Candidatus Saccharimonadales bacterium]|nr:class II fructose-bisphosphate aldolase [Candidatus Saccharimonadales bacterium]